MAKYVGSAGIAAVLVVAAVWLFAPKTVAQPAHPAERIPTSRAEGRKTLSPQWTVTYCGRRAFDMAMLSGVSRTANVAAERVGWCDTWANIKTLHKLFNEDARSTEWSITMERLLQQNMRRSSLAAGMTLQSVICHQTVCEIHATGPREVHIQDWEAAIARMSRESCWTFDRG